MGIEGDVAAVADSIATSAASRSWPERVWVRELREVREAQLRKLAELAVPETPMHAIYVHKALQSVMRRDDFLTFEGGDFCHFGRAYLPALEPRSWHYFSAVGMLRKLDNIDFLLIDDLGYLPQGAEESEVLFTLIAERYERRSLGITSNLVFSQWEKVFANPMATAAAIDRIVHHSIILEFDVPSYRTGAAQQRLQQEVYRQE